MDYNKKKEIVRLIKSTIDPVLVFHTLGLKVVNETSSEIRSKCPFHEGKNPTSFRFNKHTGYWLCFSQACHEGSNDIFGLVMKKLGISFEQAFSYLANLIGIDLEEEERNGDASKLLNEAEIINYLTKIKGKKIRHKDPIYDQKVLLEMKKNDSSYFFMRDGFSDNIISYFELGGSYVDIKGIVRSAIPIRNEDGDLVMITGRRIDNDDDPRYLPIRANFNKGAILYNYYQAKDFLSIYDGRLFIVEGFKGCWKMVQNGFANTVACMGSSVTEDQAKLIFKDINIREIILLLDGDEAGRKGIKRAVNNIKPGCTITNINLPRDTDPSMYTQEETFNILDRKNNNYLLNLIRTLRMEKEEYEYEKRRTANGLRSNTEGYAPQ